MDLDKLKQMLMQMFASSPVGQINQATGQAAQAAGVQPGASPLTDMLKQRAGAAAQSAGAQMPQMPAGVMGAVNQGNGYLDQLHDKLMSLFQGGGQGGR